MNRTTELKDFKTILRRHNLKATPQRVAVHEAMMRLGHASADMVADEIRAAASTKVTTASVYNILTQMALIGVYSHRLSSNNKMYFDVNTYPHIHLYDCENHAYKDVIDDELMAAITDKLSRRKFRGYSVESLDIQLVVRPTRRRVSSKS